MKLIHSVAACLLAAHCVSRADVVISQYYEGASNNKYIELHNPTAAAIAMNGYRLTLWTNAAAENWKADGGTPSQSYDLSAVTLQPGDYYLFAHTSAQLPDYARTTANVRNSSVINFNGNDSVVLYNSDNYAVDNILDAAAFTNLGNEGMDKSFHRISSGLAWDTVPGSNLTGFPGVWELRALADVASATTADLWYLTAQAATVGPTLDTFTVAGDAAVTAVEGVILSFTSSGASATEFIASEDAAFAGATWQQFTAAPKFTLSEGAGVKTVYFKLRNAGGESGVLNDTIALTSYTYSGAVVLTQYYEGAANNKHIEIANLSAAPVDLSTWNIARWTNQDAENWKYTGAAATNPSQAISLATVNIDGLGSTILAPGEVIVVSHTQAAGPAGGEMAALSSANLSHNGNDSLSLYSGTVDPANLADVLSFTELGNEGQDKSFARLSGGQGFSFDAGSKITDFAGVWREVSLETADAAVLGQNEHLGTYPGGGVPGYDAWAASYGLTRSPEGDDDDDGASNLLEYATGSVPNNGASVPEVLLTPIGATLTVTWAKGPEAAADPSLSWAIEASTTMEDGTWSIAGVFNFQNGPNSISGDYAILPGTPRVFLRLRVVRSQGA